MSKPPRATAPLADLFAGGGEVGRRMRDFDWSEHPLGPPERWPQSLKTVIRIMLSSRHAMWLGWGPEFYFFYNDAYTPTLGIKRDSALGVSARLVWAEIWKDIGPRAQSVMQTGAATWDESLLLFLQRGGYAEETYHTFSYSPVPNDEGTIGGILCVVTEETDRVIGERRLALLRTLGADLAGIKAEGELFAAVEARLAESSEDLPFALLYLRSADGKAAQLACAHHTVPDSSIAPRAIALGGDELWPATSLFTSGAKVTVENLERRFVALPTAPWDRPPRRALLVPISQHGQEPPAGFLVAGLNPYRPLDAAYTGFLDLLAGQIAAALASVRAYDGGLGVYFRDITARRNAEDALRNSQNLLRSTIDALSSHVAVLGEDGTILEVNQAWKTFADANGYLGRNFGVHSNYLTALEAASGSCDETAAARGIRAVIAGSEPRFQMEYPCHPPTEARWFLMTVTPFPGRGPVRAVVAHENITERVQATLALREAKEQAEAANRSKDHFLAVLSHELRTPLTPVLMAVASLQHDPELRPEVREDLAMMRRNIELETKLIDDLLDLNRITSGKLQLEIEEVALNEIAQRVSGICQPQVREQGVQLDCELGEDVGLISADPARLQQVLWNVLRNAIKFTPEGGRILVTTARLDAERCEIRVRDSGIGIPRAVLPRIFDVFEQGTDSINRQFGGLGLGLAICKALVNLHGGSIRAESAGLGQGATFIITLPTQAVPPAAPRSALESEVTTSQARPRLLLVEDHADTAQTLARLLCRAGYAVTIAGDVASALSTAEREPFDILLSDLGLPDGTGNELIRQLRETREVRRIAMSGFGMEEDLRRSREAGFAEHLIKPLDLGRLEAAIRRVMGRSA